MDTKTCCYLSFWSSNLQRMLFCHKKYDVSRLVNRLSTEKKITVRGSTVKRCTNLHDIYFQGSRSISTRWFMTLHKTESRFAVNTPAVLRPKQTPQGYFGPTNINNLSLEQTSFCSSFKVLSGEKEKKKRVKRCLTIVFLIHENPPDGRIRRGNQKMCRLGSFCPPPACFVDCRVSFFVDSLPAELRSCLAMTSTAFLPNILHNI